MLARLLRNSPLGIPAYRNVYLAGVSSSVGYTMQTAMAGWMMANLSGSAWMVGVVQAAATIPYLLFGFVSGSLSDLVDRRHVLIITHLLMALNATIVGVAAITGVLSPWLLVALTFLCGTGYTFHSPAQQASINPLVPRPMLARAVTLGSLAFNAARSVGPALAGLIAAMTGEGLAVVIAALFFLPMVPATQYSLAPRAVQPATRKETLWSGIQAGMRYTRFSSVMWAGVMVNFFFSIAAAAVWAMFPLVAQDRLGLAADGYGFLYSTFGLGAVFSALWLPPWLRRLPVGRVVRMSMLLWCAGALIIAASRWVPMAVLGTFMTGMAWVGVYASISTVVQSTAPLWVRARTVANNQMSVQAGLALGSLLWGALASVANLQIVLILSGIFLFAFMLVSLRLPLRLGQDADITADVFMPFWPALPGREPKHAGARGDAARQMPATGFQQHGHPATENSGDCVNDGEGQPPVGQRGEHAWRGFMTEPASMQQPEPAPAGRKAPQAPQHIIVTWRYQPRAGQQDTFLARAQALRESRRRNGARGWRLQPERAERGASAAMDGRAVQAAATEEAAINRTAAGKGAETGFWIERIVFASEAEYQRFPGRMTRTDRMLVEAVQETLEDPAQALQPRLMAQD